MARDERIDEAKGRMKEAGGDLTGNEEMKREGKMDRAAATAKEKVSEGVDKARDAVDKLRGGDKD
ncbi:MAG TPA: CsbD family protein [Acidimicrobiales bacterium]|nr:CsbD family protein [Acidimicrobiales bacterium]